MSADRAASVERTQPHLVVVGAGIVGLGAAMRAHHLGFRVTVLERHTVAHGASIRNFGHVGVTLQRGRARDLALASRKIWLDLAAVGAVDVLQDGAVVAAVNEDERALIHALAADDETIEVLDAGAVRRWAPVVDDRLLGGAHLPLDLQVDPRTSVARIAEHLQSIGVDLRFGTMVHDIENDRVVTATGEIFCSHVVVAVGADLDTLYPREAALAGIARCSLDMLALDWTSREPVSVPLLTGTSLLRYGASTGLETRERLEARLFADDPELEAHDINHMHAQRPSGELIVGDSHRYAAYASPFQPEAAFATLMRLTNTLLGEGAPIVERWQGVYAKAPETFIVLRPKPHVLALTIGSGIGMTVGLGFAAKEVDAFFSSVTPHTTRQENEHHALG